uniref:Uncharacterized protein n=1 Tax=Anguilla anguilla TaxID=7936 RepID=A0A0E9WIM2_ANGAN
MFCAPLPPLSHCHAYLVVRLGCTGRILYKTSLRNSFFKLITGLHTRDACRTYCLSLCCW